MSHHHHGPGCSHEAHDHDHDHDHNHDGHNHDGPDRGTEYSLWRYINIDQIRCLNELVEGSAKNVFRPWEERLDENKYVESDADEQLLIHVPFTGQVKLKAIALRCRPDETAPSDLKVFINNDQLDFDSAESTEPTQSWELVSPADIVRAMDAQGGVVEYPTRVSKFGAVRSLTMFIPTNFGGDTSVINYIGLRGDFTPLNKDPIITMYEAAANPADHAPIVGTDPLSSQKPGL